MYFFHAPFQFCQLTASLEQKNRERRDHSLFASIEETCLVSSGSAGILLSFGKRQFFPVNPQLGILTEHF